MLEDRVTTYHKLLQEGIDNPHKSEVLLQKAMLIDMLGLNTLILTKNSFESSPDFDSWMLQGLSYKTGKEYFSEKDGTRDYQRENNYMVFHFRDWGIIKRIIQNMIPCGVNSWEYIGHVRDLVTD